MGGQNSRDIYYVFYIILRKNKTNGCNIILYR